MKELHIKKWPVVFPLVLLIAVLLGYTLLNFRGASAADSLTLGQQRLNDMDYTGAVSAFNQVIELDPNNLEARVGLAQAYAGTEDYATAQEMLDQVVYTEQPDEGACAAMIQIFRDSGQLPQALILSQTLIDSTDQEAYYDLRQELLTESLSYSQPLAVGTDYALTIQNGQVLGVGSNAMGQLGLDAAALPAAEELVPLNFPGTAVKAACAGRTSFIIDDSGALWAAGENRWGQMGGGAADTAPLSGWVQVPCSGPAADVCGTTGRLLVLMADGSLWAAGAGTGQTLQPLAEFSAVSAIAADSRQAAVLTTGGELYTSSSSDPADWTLQARDVCSFSLSDGALRWVDREGYLSGVSGSSLPEGWQDESGSPRAGQAVVQLAVTEDLFLFLSSDGALYRITESGELQEVEGDAPAVHLDVQGDTAVVVYADGTAAYWSGGASAPRPLSSFALGDSRSS